jgi:hypothetical protein
MKKAIARWPFLGRAIAVRQSGARGQKQPDLASDDRQRNAATKARTRFRRSQQHHPKCNVFADGDDRRRNHGPPSRPANNRRSFHFLIAEATAPAPDGGPKEEHNSTPKMNP